MTTNVNVDVGEYCRRVEEHLSRVNEGHLVRIVGTGFELVRQWAEDGIPFSVACRGIDMKAERHRAGRSTRPLRIEFCEPDVRAVFQDWKRAVGVTGAAAGPEASDAAPAEPADDVRRPSIAKHLDRVAASLTRAAGRLETPEPLRDELTRILEAVVAAREASRGRRTTDRAGLARTLAEWDAALMAAARRAAAAEWPAWREEAAAELEAYRARMPRDVWERSVDVAADRLVRERLHLPAIEL